MIAKVLLTLFLSLSLNSNADAFKTEIDISKVRQEAEQGDSNAQFILGGSYKYGNGVLKDYRQAFKWFKLSAEQGKAGAQNSLAMLYAYGEGTLKDLGKAKYWVKKSYENPNADINTLDLAEDIWNDFKLWKY